MAEPREHRLSVNGIELACYEWGRLAERRADATVLLLHATGFHARCWDAVVRRLPASTHVVAADLRGHGRSSKKGPYVWDTFRGDVVALIENLELSGIVGVGHSMGGHCMTLTAAALPECFTRLVLIDPVIQAPAVYAARRDGPAAAEDHPTARRKNHWRGPGEMFERFEDREPFSLWRREVLADYCDYGLVPRADGRGYELACPPLVEASIYMGSTGTTVYDDIARVRVPVTVLRARERDRSGHAGMDFSASPTWPELAGAFPDGRDVYLPELTHFIPMQEPDLVARYVAGTA